MLREIRSQPEHIRALFMWLSVFIVFSLIVLAWANSLQQKLVFLVNGEQEEEAEEIDESPFALIGGSFSDIKSLTADLIGLITGKEEDFEVINEIEEKHGIEIEPRLLPVSEDEDKR